MPPARRPYRSHAVPACAHCRARKQRCVQDIPGKACLACSQNVLDCSAASRTYPPFPKGEAETIKGKQSYCHSRPVARKPPIDHGTLMDQSSEQRSRSPSQSAHIIGPSVAHDLRTLKDYLNVDDEVSEPQARPNPYNIYSDDPKDPIIYRKAPRKRAGLPDGMSLKYLADLERLIHPYAHFVIDLFFEAVHPFFPILDEQYFRESYKKGKAPPTLTCVVYAISTPYWSESAKLRNTPKPDVAQVWNLAVSALHDGYLCPSFSTLLASLLDLCRRPITSVTGNAVLLGRSVALAYTLGLNRDPASWNLDHRQKSLRTRAWWALLIHDRCLCHGTPPLIGSSYFDVPIPCIDALHSTPPDLLTFDRKSVLLQGANEFIVLCNQTNALSKALKLIYQTCENDPVNLQRNMVQLQTEVDELQLILVPWQEVKRDLAQPRKVTYHVTGSLSLNLSYIAVLLCMRKLWIQCKAQNLDQAIPIGGSYKGSASHLDPVSDVRDMLNYIAESSDNKHTRGFWMPSVTTFSLRHAIEEKDAKVAASQLQDADRIISVLKDCRQRADWDLADICLNQCEDVLHRMQARMKTRQDVNRPVQSSRERSDTESRSISVTQAEMNVAPVDWPMEEDLVNSLYGMDDLYGLPFSQYGYSGNDLEFPDIWDLDISGHSFAGFD
ncbi:hypothetical protein FH972_024418 [Carpinus fangiana]|uniref:Zn(2)-C6 fungal-type domain-containing protein n=1 Tax=Carpinus fangiana TaxID=176857 RepID=A0A5N6KYA3_9ROSI|nr:hypothetical protein FH972_024418 [Carpinus fangiana]